MCQRNEEMVCFMSVVKAMFIKSVAATMNMSVIVEGL